MYPFYDYPNSYRQTEKIIANLTKAINGEYSAIQCYQKLANMAPTQKEKEQILEIKQDESKHLHTFSQLYVNLTGSQPIPQLMEQCPNNYKKGLEFALIDEQQTVDFYLDVSDETADPRIKAAFKRAALDEQNHAVWFLYFLTKQKY
ncbi:ferritin-like domain-containing protein [Cytobacillus dafuensis]|uniref:Ferritin-like domain-containing protein n=1 Tax=Cytobacillus dafuensis TaxID=1742359 RepID=A0A5B8Z8V5_CYTDA|nr:ferritin-like domain-containing protein [Cytobacillus dafuensis]QED47886.1 ferritin-like domain-containing protein [Cytobacillus dafuensis]